MNTATLNALYQIAAQALTPPDHRWLEGWRWLLGSLQLDLWVHGEDEAVARPLLRMMQNLPSTAEEEELKRLEHEFLRLLDGYAIDVTQLSTVRTTAQRWKYTFARPRELGLAAGFKFLAHLCCTGESQRFADAERRALLEQTLGALILTAAHRLHRKATTPFYQAVGEFLIALIKRDLSEKVFTDALTKE